MPRFSQLTVTTLAFALSLFLSSLTGASAQTTGIDDLPDCAKDCARTSATAAGCGLTDVACLCSKPSFSTATQQCVIPVCGFGDRSTVSGVLREMCENSTPSQAPASSASTATRPSASASASASSSSGAAPAPNPTSTTATSTITTGRTTVANTATGTTTTPLSPSTTLGVGGVTNSRSSSSTGSSDSSTTLVVATVVLPQTTTTSAAGSLTFDAGTGLVGALLAALMGGLVL